MIKKTTLSFFNCIIILSLLFLSEVNLYAQSSISPQQLPFKDICAGDIVDGVKFNEYRATFSYLNFAADVTFSVQLSDEFGSFSNPTAATTLEVIPLSGTEQTIKFAIPTTLKGSDTYSLRIVSSNGINSPRAQNFSGETSFSAYYKDYVTSFLINENRNTATFCSGGSFTLTVDDLPANFPNIKYKWYKDDVLISGQNSASLVVNSAGVYFAELEYGECSNVNYSSNRVTVSSSNSGSAVTISSSLGNPFCSSGQGTVLTATAGNGHVWRKDGKVIENENGRTIEAKESGIYTVEVDFGGCVSSGTIDLKSTEFTSSINVPATNVITQGETLTATVTTDAVDPTFEWFLNNGPVGTNSNTYTATRKGDYKVIVTQSVGCVVKKEFLFSVAYDIESPTSVTKLANIISLSSESYGVWDIPSEYKNPQTSVKIISSNGDMVLDVVNYQGDWPPAGSIDIKNVNPVYYYVIQSDTGEKKGSITLIK